MQEVLDFLIDAVSDIDFWYEAITSVILVLYIRSGRATKGLSKAEKANKKALLSSFKADLKLFFSKKSSDELSATEKARCDAVSLYSITREVKDENS